MEAVLTCVKAFLFGGLLCLLGQALIDHSRLTPARILTIYVTVGLVLSALGLYGPVAEAMGAGATVPLTGFGHALAEGVQKAVDEEGLLGAFTGGFTACAAGLGAAVFFGLLVSLIFKPKGKG